MALEKIFLSFPMIFKSMGAKDHWDMANLDPWVWLLGFMKGTTRHYYILNI